MYPPLYSPSLRAVDPDSGCRHHPFEVDEDVLASGLRRQLETTTIERDELVGLLVKTMPRQLDVGMRNHDRFEFGIVEILVVRAFALRCGCNASCGSWAEQGGRRLKDLIARWYPRERKVRAQHCRESCLTASRIHVYPIRVDSWNIFLPYTSIECRFVQTGIMAMRPIPAVVRGWPARSTRCREAWRDRSQRPGCVLRTRQ